MVHLLRNKHRHDQPGGGAFRCTGAPLCPGCKALTTIRRISKRWLRMKVQSMPGQGTEVRDVHRWDGHWVLGWCTAVRGIADAAMGQWSCCPGPRVLPDPRRLSGRLFKLSAHTACVCHAGVVAFAIRLRCTAPRKILSGVACRSPEMPCPPDEQA